MRIVQLLLFSGLLVTCLLEPAGPPPQDDSIAEVTHPKHQPQILPNEELQSITASSSFEANTKGSEFSLTDDHAKESISHPPTVSFPVQKEEHHRNKEETLTSDENIVVDESIEDVSVAKPDVTSTTAEEGSEDVALHDAKEEKSSEKEAVTKELDDKTVTEEEIPSFKEFREKKEKEDKIEKESREDEKRLREEQVDSAKKEKVKDTAKGKLIQKNYADTICGAKIVDSKKGFKNVGTLLNSNKDLYAMIPCEGGIWFVVELCDTIQIHAIQLANYELFSSSVDEFKIYVAESYPPKEWRNVGTFSTVNKRELQKFDVNTNGEYSKFVKFEKVSFRGKEHFCVLSTFEVLGMSMIDEYEEQQQPLDIDPYEQPLDLVADPMDKIDASDKSIIEGARDAVKNMVDSALNVLGVSKNEEKGDNSTISGSPGKEVNKTKPEEQSKVVDSVVVKVDESGNEIKEVAEPDSRLKGEVSLQEPQENAKNNVPEIAAKPIVPREPIMEGIDLSKEDSEVKEKGNAVAEDALSTVDNDKQDANSETKSKHEEEKPTAVEKPAESKAEVSDTKVLSETKGVVMTNSPKKNSIFVELDKKIKELEKNLSLSNDYLETLSSRYKRVDNLFKPLEKTLSTVDEAMANFEERMKRLEDKIDMFASSIDAILYHIEDLEVKSNNLTTSTNLILFLLLMMLLFFWRMSNKLHYVYTNVCEPPPIHAKTKLPEYNEVENSMPRKRQRSKPNRSRDSSPRPRPGALVPSKSESNIPKKVNFTDTKKPLESVQMDLIYPQQKSPTAKRRGKHQPR